jgi:hypothetical protein
MSKNRSIKKIADKLEDSLSKNEPISGISKKSKSVIISYMYLSTFLQYDYVI